MDSSFTACTKTGLKDPMGTPFIDNKLVANAKKALTKAGLQLVNHNIVLATKAEAKECFAKFKKMDDVDAVLIFLMVMEYQRANNRASHKRYIFEKRP